MKIGRDVIFHAISAISLLLAAVVLWLWGSRQAAIILPKLRLRHTPRQSDVPNADVKQKQN
jgi:hypothetical protein